MATSKGFKQSCPSCEHSVPIKDRNLIGRKIDCPKCKYRFVVEDPGSDEEDEAPPEDKTAKKKPAKASAGKKPAKRPDTDDDEDDEDRPQKKGKEGGSSTVLILGIGLGLVAVVLLIVGGIVLFGGDSSSDDSSNKTVSNTSQTSSGDSPPSKIPGLTPPPTEEKPKEVPPRRGHEPPVTNLLPNDTEGIVDMRVDRACNGALGKIVIDRQTGSNPDLFPQSRRAAGKRDPFYNGFQRQPELGLWSSAHEQGVRFEGLESHSEPDQGPEEPTPRHGVFPRPGPCGPLSPLFPEIQ